MEPGLVEITPLRRQPAQERSRRRVHDILDATEALFLEIGAEAITTNHIAERANTDIRGVYYFFEDKFQIFEAIVRRAVVALEAEISRCASLRASSAEEWIDRLLDTHHAFSLRWSGTIQLFAVLRGRPEMETLVRDYDARIRDVFALGLRTHCPELPSAYRRTAAHVLNVAMGELLHNALSNPSVREQRAILRETRVLLTAYVCAERNEAR